MSKTPSAKPDYLGQILGCILILLISGSVILGQIRAGDISIILVVSLSLIAIVTFVILIFYLRDLRDTLLSRRH